MKRLYVAALTLLLLTATVYALPAVYEIPQTYAVSEGAYGSWQVPCIGTRSTLYESPGVGQDVIDAENSALFQRYGKGFAIFDHSYSEVGGGVWCVEKMQAGCGAFLCREGKPEVCYECTAIYLAQQIGNYYKTRNGFVSPSAKEIMCVSCADEDGWVFIAIFEYVGEMP